MKTFPAQKRIAGGFTLVEIMIVVAIIGILIAIAVPGFIRARSQSRMRSCQENLTKLDGAKEQYALENNKKPGDPVPQASLVDPVGGTGYLKQMPIEPSGYTYVIDVIGTNPTCASGLPGHSITEIGTTVTAIE